MAGTDSHQAMFMATLRVLEDKVVELRNHRLVEVVEEPNGWWVCWGPPVEARGGGPNVLVSKLDGGVVDVYCTQRGAGPR